MVGSDIALAGFDDIPAGRDVTPGLTTVRVPLEDVGYLALRAAVDEEWDADAGPLTLEVVLRDSTPLAPPRRRPEHATAMKVVLAPDSFKGSISAADAVAGAGGGWRTVMPS